MRDWLGAELGTVTKARREFPSLRSGEKSPLRNEVLASELATVADMAASAPMYPEVSFDSQLPTRQNPKTSRFLKQFALIAF
jgi:hypothetical protein